MSDLSGLPDPISSALAPFAPKGEAPRPRSVSDDERAECDGAVSDLGGMGFVCHRDLRNVGACEYELHRGPVTMRIALRDWQAPTSGVVILTMAVQPPTERSKGYGSKAVRDLIDWARAQGLETEMRAVQVSDLAAARFWGRLGFEKVGGSFTGDYVRREPSAPPEPVVRWCVKKGGQVDTSALYMTREDAERLLAYTGNRWGVQVGGYAVVRVEIRESPV